MKKPGKFRREGYKIMRGNDEYATASTEHGAANIVYALNFTEGRKDDGK